MKADCKIFKGIEYVQVSELPQAQRDALARTINPERFIKLLIDGKIISGCLQYKDYAQWYVESFLPGADPVQPEASPQEVQIKTGLALNKL